MEIYFETYFFEVERNYYVSVSFLVLSICILFGTHTHTHEQKQVYLQYNSIVVNTKRIQKYQSFNKYNISD